MNLHINGLNIDVSDALRERITTKLERVNRHSSGSIISVNFTLSSDKHQHKAAAHLHLAGKDLHVEAVENEMQAAIDVLMDKIDRAVLQHKEKSHNVR